MGVPVFLVSSPSLTRTCSTIWVTEYESAVTVTLTTSPPAWTAPTTAVSTFAPLTKRTVTASATETAVPTYLSPQCSDAVQFGSACSCWSVTGPTVTASVPDVTSTSTVAVTVTHYDYESPPLPSSSVSFPANSWTKSYTYAEYTLPVFTSAPDPSVVVDYPTPVETCLMDANPTGDAFVSRTNLCAHSSPEADDIMCSTFSRRELDMS